MIAFEVLGLGGEDDVNRLYNAVYKANRTREQFRWEFVNGPAGRAIYVVARDTDTGKIVGTQCAIPLYLITHSGQQILSAKSEDTLVDPAYRGKQIFEKMYELLFAECRKAGIHYLWGFTYAIKPFVKIGFDVPFQTNMGLVCFQSRKSFGYLTSLNPKNTAWTKLKIFSLVALSRLNSMRLKSKAEIPDEYAYSEEPVQDPRSLVDQQLSAESLFSLHEDTSFMDWRVSKNPYPHEYVSFSLKGKGGQLVAFCVCSVDSGVSFIVQQLFARNLSDVVQEAFMHTVMQKLRRKAFIVRYWGFENNTVGARDVRLLKEIGFTFINRGISFVWKSLSPEGVLNPKKMLLSRMAAQGT